MAILLYAVFALSGAAGLIYETIWSRYLGLFVGHSAYAQVIVLVIFLGGMSLGAAGASQRSERIAQPLLWYAGIELLVGVIGIAFDSVFVSATNLSYDVIFPALGSGVSLVVAKWTIAAVLILPQSVLLGMTFPLMSAGVLRVLRTPVASSGRVLGLLYFTNSLGAATGGLLAGFVLITESGLPGTLLAAAIINLVVALAVIVAVRVRRGQQAGAAAQAGEPAPAAPAASDAMQGGHDDRLADPAFRRLWRVLLWVAGGTALASFIYEIAWIRMLSLVLGGATHSFELMLSAFILGLALGAWWVRSRADRFADPVRALGITQVVMGTLAVATMPVYLESFEWFATLMQALAPSAQGYGLFTLAKYGVALSVMLPATFCAGITLPLITRTLLAARSGERAIGTVYAVNTLGSIVGAALAGMVLMPLLGLKLLLIAGALVDIGFGIWLLAGATTGVRARARTWWPAAAASLACVVLLGMVSRFDQRVLTSGVYRYAAAKISPESRTLFYADGRTATVSAREDTATGQRSLATNGKPDASLGRIWRVAPDSAGPTSGLGGDQAAQILLPIITLAYAPQAAHVAVIGQGSGMSSHVLLGSESVTALTTIEIEPKMIEGSRVFLPANRRVFDDARARFVIDDAKSVFAASRQQYDLILSEPSNPWVSGVSGLFTDEFYERVKVSLTDRGVLGQWLHLYETNDLLVLSVLAAVQRNFPSYELYMASSSDMLIIASKAPQLPAPDWSVVRQRELAEDLRRVYPLTPRAFEGTWLAGSAALGPLLKQWPGVNSDYFPVLDLGTERARFMRTSANGFYGLATDRFSIVHAMTGRRDDFGTERDAAMEIARVEALALGTRLRSAMAQPTGIDPAMEGDAFLPNALFEARSMQAFMATGKSPGNWKAWISHVADLEEVVHGGTAGVVDEQFYAQLVAYMRKANAPFGARAGVQFVHALSKWDWTTADVLINTLLVLERKSDPWVGAALLRSGGVVARLKMGRVAEARKLYNELTPGLRVGPGDVRSLLLDAWIRAAEKPDTARPAGGP